MKRETQFTGWNEREFYGRPRVTTLAGKNGRSEAGEMGMWSISFQVKHVKNCLVPACALFPVRKSAAQRGRKIRDKMKFNNENSWMEESESIEECLADNPVGCHRKKNYLTRKSVPLSSETETRNRSTKINSRKIHQIRLIQPLKNILFLIGIRLVDSVTCWTWTSSWEQKKGQMYIF